MKKRGRDFAARDAASKRDKRGSVQVCTVGGPKPALLDLSNCRCLVKSSRVEVGNQEAKVEIAAPWAIIRKESKLPFVEVLFRYSELSSMRGGCR